MRVAMYRRQSRLLCTSGVDDFGDHPIILVGVAGLWRAATWNDATFESGKSLRIEFEYVRNVGFIMGVRCFLEALHAMFGKKRTGK